jgi:hypothetical protein
VTRLGRAGPDASSQPARRGRGLSEGGEEGWRDGKMPFEQGGSLQFLNSARRTGVGDESVDDGSYGSPDSTES